MRWPVLLSTCGSILFNFICCSIFFTFLDWWSQNRCLVCSGAWLAVYWNPLSAASSLPDPVINLVVFGARQLSHWWHANQNGVRLTMPWHWYTSSLDLSPQEFYFRRGKPLYVITNLFFLQVLSWNVIPYKRFDYIDLCIITHYTCTSINIYIWSYKYVSKDVNKYT